MYRALNKGEIDLAGDHKERRDRRIRAGGAGWLRMRVQREEQRFHVLGFRFSQRRPHQRDALRANVGAEPAGHDGHDK